MYDVTRARRVSSSARLVLFRNSGVSSRDSPETSRRFLTWDLANNKGNTRNRRLELRRDSADGAASFTLRHPTWRFAIKRVGAQHAAPHFGNHSNSTLPGSAYALTAVQNLHLFAARGISLKHSGQARVVGSGVFFTFAIK
jgi:hypothetical protein